MIKSFIKYFSFFLVMLLFVVLIWSIWEANRDHLSALDQGAGQTHIIKDSTINTQLTSEQRVYRDITLNSFNSGKINFYLSLPTEISDEGLPIIIILGGLQIGRNNFSFVENPGKNAIVIYKYPYDRSYWYEGTAMVEIPKIRNAVHSVPSQVIETILWLQKQIWYDDERTSIAGYSFGALFTPAVYRLADKYQINLKHGILSYGGAGLYPMLKVNLKKHNWLGRELIARFVSTAINSIDPIHHLSFLKNEFLIINGNKDKQIPEECWQELHKLVPEPKTIIILNEGHMHPRKPELTKKLVNLSRQWLYKKGVLNP